MSKLLLAVLLLLAPAWPIAAAAEKAVQVPAALPPNAERLSHGRFEDLVAYRPAGEAGGFVLLLSGDNGWDGAAADLAQALARKGALVVGIDTPRFFATLEHDGGDCEFSDGDLENLSHFVQAYYRLPTYLAPILVGYGPGATFAYANLVQAPKDTFGGALALGFCPQLDLAKPMCKGSGLEYKRRADGKGVEFLPAPALSNPATFLQGGNDTLCGGQATAGFLSRTQGATLVALPGVDHGFGDPGLWQPQLLDAYARLAQTLKPVALPAPPASLNGLPVIEQPVKAGVPQTEAFALLMSGDGGWAGLDQDVAAALTAHGIPVVGLDSLRYYWTPRTPDSAAADVDRIVRYYLAHWGKSKVLLVGYSQGADVLPFILNRLPPATRRQVALGAVMGLSEHALFEFHLGNWVDANQDQGLPTLPEMQRAGDTSMLCIYGAEETDTLCPKLDPQHVHLVKLVGGHHFGGDYERLAREILEAAKLPVTEVAATSSTAGAPQASGPSGPTNQEEPTMLTVHVMLMPLLSLIAGILILVMPRLLNYIVAIYLIVIGILGLVHVHL
ncbi:MAG: DUF3096 domain-containing protein [Nevskia sp.]|nr:DUF3096 domain-containing protein [Nevskia sp.]